MSDEQVAAFRVRAMIFDQLVPQLYKCSKPCCKHSNAIDNIIQGFSTDKYDKIIEGSSDSDPYIHNQAPAVVLQPATKTIPQNTTDTADDETAPPADESTPDDALISPLELSNVPLMNVYHTFENDLAAMIEQRKLEEYEAQEEMNDKDNPSDKTISILNASSNFSLKYLLEAIEQNRAVTKLGDRELRNLLTDVRPHRSKWANEDKLGQEELYESCEKVLMDLKNYTEHSTPFLNKVNKREAPDYYDVIKKPMDLGLVTKKLKACHYKSKKEFADDLYLIYENCLVYNTNPQASEYRKHAIAMRKKTDKLLVHVPDVNIRDRSDVEAEDEAEESDEHETEENSHKASRKAPGTSKHLANSNSGEKNGSDVPASTPSDPTREPSLAPSNDGSQADHDMEGHNNGNGQVSLKGLSGVSHTESNGVIDREQEERNINAEIEANMGILQDEIWRDLTKKTRAKVSSDAQKQSELPFGDRTVLQRSFIDMKRFSMMEQAHESPETIRKLITASNDNIVRWIEQGNNGLYEDCDTDDDDSFDDGFLSRRIANSNKAQVDDSSRSDLFLPEYSVTSGIPEIIDIPEDVPDKGRRGSIDGLETDQDYGYSDVSLDRYSTVAIPNHGTSEMIDDNLQTLRQIRRVYAKCLAVRNDVPITAMNTSQTYPEASQVGEADAASPRSNDGASAAPYGDGSEWSSQVDESIIRERKESVDQQELVPLILNQDAGQELMQRTVVKLIEHAGFEASQSSALAVLSDVATNYFSSLGKTLRVYWDTYCNKMSDEEILTHTLYDNGVISIQELEDYIHDDIEKYGHRLNDIHRKLTSSYNELINGSTDVQLPDDSLFQTDDAFVSGAFGEDIGEDFFGFKDLGLDKELNMDRLSVPLKLWYGKDKVKAQTTGPKSNEPVLEHPPPPPFVRIRSTDGIIKLLQPYFKEKLEKSEGNLVEDEYQTVRRTRPRYPPISSKAGALNRKRPLKDSNGENKKTKKKKPMEILQAERAEKKKQKEEAKAQKVAEREQKKKMKEELKERDRLAKLEAKREKV
ncbi:unnamed protein product [Umbelopsis ramanniana]